MSSKEESRAAAPAKSATTEPAADDPLLLTSPAMRGKRVRAVQMALQSLGYDVGAVDGTFGKLRQVEVLQSQGMAVADAIHQIGVSEVTYYRWRKEYGGMGTERLKELEKENPPPESIRPHTA